MSNKNDWIDAIASCARVKLPNGLVGKLSKVLFMFVIVFGIILGFAIFKCSQTIIIFLVVMFVSVLLILGLALIIFASRHPDAALLEGAEFIMHEQIKLATKNNNEIEFNPSKQGYRTLVPNSEELAELAEQPDVEN